MLFVFCFLLFAIFLQLVFLLLIRFFVARDKLTNFEKNKKYIARNTIVDKTVAKEKIAKGKKQETGNKEHIVE